ncbi:hypothetical protein ES703_85285 [subsurface metagenome]
MEDVQVGTDGTYRTSDFYVATYLLYKGLQIQGIDRHNPRRSEFIFLDREDRPQLVQSFLCGQAAGNLPDFIFYIRKAKRLLYSREV